MDLVVVAEDDGARRDGGDAKREKSVLHAEDPGAECLRRVAGEDRHGPLGDDGAAVELLVDKVHRDARDHRAVGEDSRIGAGCVVSHAVIGAASCLHSGVLVGQEGFGLARTSQGLRTVPHLGRAVIGSDVEIGAGCTIDRGSLDDTVIGDGCRLDNLVHIAHNVKLGRGCVIVAQVGISGSTVIEDGVVLAGQAGIAGHLTIGKGARIAAQSGVIGDVPAGEEWVGFPAMPRRAFWRFQAGLKKLLSNRGSQG